MKKYDKNNWQMCGHNSVYTISLTICSDFIIFYSIT